MPGVKDAFVIEGNGNAHRTHAGVAIIADNTWAAIQGQASLKVELGQKRGVEAIRWTGFGPGQTIARPSDPRRS